MSPLLWADTTDEVLLGVDVPPRRRCADATTVDVLLNLRK